jgi:hypothetical protein
MSQRNEPLNDQETRSGLGVTSEMAIRKCMRGVLSSRSTRTHEICVVRPGSERLSRGARLMIQLPDEARDRKRKAFDTGRVINEAAWPGLLAHPEDLPEPPVDPPPKK